MNKQFPVIAAMALLTMFVSQAAGAAADLDKSIETFKKLDVNNNGFISLKEAEVNPDLEDAFVDADVNEDGQLSLAEFEKMNIE